MNFHVVKTQHLSFTSLWPLNITMKNHQIPWNSIKVNQPETGITMKFHENPQNAIKIHQNLSVYVHESSWTTIRSKCCVLTTWTTMNIHERQWLLINIHENLCFLPWKSMYIHGHSWIFMVKFGWVISRQELSCKLIRLRLFNSTLLYGYKCALQNSYQNKLWWVEYGFNGYSTEQTGMCVTIRLVYV